MKIRLLALLLLGSLTASSQIDLEHEFEAGPNSRMPFQLNVYNNKLCFTISDPVYQYELWTYDGTSPPTMVNDLNPTGQSLTGTANQRVTTFQTALYFATDDGVHGFERAGMMETINLVSFYA